MNNAAIAGECSSGCESGWTLYLEKSWLSPNCSFGIYEGDQDEYGVRSGLMNIYKQRVEEEDMSMVSDASSGPPHFIDDSGFNFNHHCGCFYPLEGVVETNVVNGSAALSEKSQGRKKRNNDNTNKQKMMLDDTASSKPVIPQHLKKQELGARNKSQSLMESHRMDNLSHGFSSTHIQAGLPPMDLFGH